MLSWRAPALVMCDQRWSGSAEGRGANGGGEGTGAWRVRCPPTRLALTDPGILLRLGIEWLVLVVKQGIRIPASFYLMMSMLLIVTLLPLTRICIKRITSSLGLSGIKRRSVSTETRVTKASSSNRQKKMGDSPTAGGMRGNSFSALGIRKASNRVLSLLSISPPCSRSEPGSPGLRNVTSSSARRDKSLSYKRQKSVWPQ